MWHWIYKYECWHPFFTPEAVWTMTIEKWTQIFSAHATLHVSEPPITKFGNILVHPFTSLIDPNLSQWNRNVYFREHSRSNFLLSPGHQCKGIHVSIPGSSTGHRRHKPLGLMDWHLQEKHEVLLPETTEHTVHEHHTKQDVKQTLINSSENKLDSGHPGGGVRQGCQNVYGRTLYSISSQNKCPKVWEVPLYNI